MSEESKSLYNRTVEVLSGSTEQEQRELARDILVDHVDESIDYDRVFVQDGLIYDADKLTLSDFLDAGRFNWRFYPRSQTMPAPIGIEVKATISDTSQIENPHPVEQTQSPVQPATMTWVDCLLQLEGEVSHHSVGFDTFLSVAQSE